MKKFTSLIAVAIIGLVFAFSLVIPAQAQSQKMVRVLIGYKNQPGNVDLQRIRGFGGQTGYSYHRMPVMTATVPENQLQFLRNSPNVAYVEEDVVVNALDDTVPWGVSQIHADLVHPFNEGAGIKVAIIDTGIDIDHPDLNVQGGVNYVTSGGSYDDDNGHGTHVAGITAALDNDAGIVGVAPQAALYAVKVLNNYGSGSWSTVISGIEWSIDNGMQVINMSLGATSGSVALQNACNNAWNAGIIVVAAAGNSGSGTNTVLYPAQYTTSVIAVAATNSSNTRASFSSTGPAVELAAPGYRIYSTYRGGGYTTLDGTSMASPHVAGVAVLVIATGISDANGNGRINDEVRTRLDTTALHLGTGDPGTRNNLYGYGLVDAYKAAGIDHYTVSNISSPQNGGVGFSVTILAQNQNNNNINAGSETVNITFGQADDGATVTPTPITTTDGTATVSITMTKACTGQTITFTGASSHKSGTSNSFDVVAVLDHITVTPANPQIVTGGTLTFTAQGYTATNIPISGLTYGWSCIDSVSPTGSTIDLSTGFFTAGSVGTCTVRAESAGIHFDTTVIIVPIS